MNSAVLLTAADVRDVFAENTSIAIQLVKHALMQSEKGNILLPDKISQVFDQETQNRINCMPATLLSEKLCGVKWVSVFPRNPQIGKPNVMGTIILSEIQNGTTLSVMDGSYITSLRTAAVGAVAAEALAIPSAQSIGFIGAGKEARHHLDLIKAVRPSLKVCRVSSRTSATVEQFIAEESPKHPDMTFVACGNDYEKAAQNADVIVTATSSQLQLLKASYIKPGALYIHVGGLEDEYAVALKADKIVCDDWESIKHRTQTISQMYQQGLLKDEDIYANLGDILCEKKSKRESEDEFIYFCSVGLAFIDVYFAKYAYEIGKSRGIGTSFNFMED